jgi:uncharacterized small protein (DUF1192 family)
MHLLIQQSQKGGDFVTKDVTVQM